MRPAVAYKQYPAPLFILAGPRSYTSLVCTMIGQHPAAYGVPELNLFITDTLQEMAERLTGYSQIQLHGLLRTVSHVYAGEQTLASVEMARRWILTRLSNSTGEVYHELCEKVTPLRIVDKSPVYSLKRRNLKRIRAAFPNAKYLHLTRHPRSQGQSVMGVAKGLMAILVDSIDYAVDPPIIDPQIMWYEMQRNILEFLKEIPAHAQMRVQGEEVIGEPRRLLGEICRWLDMDDDEAALDAMLHPEESPFAHPGPLGAHLGNDVNFLRSPRFRPGTTVTRASLDGALPWREDEGRFYDVVADLARDLGYS